MREDIAQTLMSDVDDLRVLGVHMLEVDLDDPMQFVSDISSVIQGLTYLDLIDDRFGLFKNSN